MDDIRSQLTPRQRQVLCLAAHSNRQIASRLGISHQTVKNHWSAIYKRLLPDEEPSRVRALLVAIQLGIVELDDLDYGRPIVERGGR